ncbi:MAG: hypothetical protein ACE5ER_00915 [Nitrospinaceae bacterium]
MAWKVQKVESAKNLDRFIRFPHTLYPGDSPWVPPLIAERRKFLDSTKNPFFKHAEVEHFLAVDPRGDIAGRISAIQDHAHNEFHNERAGFFGMFECVHDQAVSNLLLDTVFDWCRRRRLDTLRGPFNLSTNHECGLLVEGFEVPPIFGIPYNPPYYAGLLEEWGLAKAKDLLSLELTQLQWVPEYMQRAASRILKRGRFTLRSIRMDEFEKELSRVWSVYDAAWNRNWGYVPMPQDEFLFAARQMKPILIPELCYIAEVAGDPAGFSLTLPDLNQTLKKMKGRLFPLGFLHFVFGRGKIDAFRTLTLGVKPMYRKLGIDLLFYFRTYEWLIAHRARMCDQSWILEDNQAMVNPILRLGGVIYKRHRIYERPCPS